MLRDSEETCLFKVKFWSSMTPSILMVSENGMRVPAIAGDATEGKVRRRWQVLIRIDSDLLLFTSSAPVLPQLTVSSCNYLPQLIYIAIFMDLSAMSHRHLDTCLYSTHSCKPVNQLRTCRPSCLDRFLTATVSLKCYHIPS